MNEVLAEFNVYRHNDADTVEGDLHELEKRHGAQLMALNEVTGDGPERGVSAFVKRMAWSAYQPREGRELALIWNPGIWRAEPFFGVRRISGSGPVKFTPPRHLIWQGLYHRPSGTRHLVYVTHVTQGYAKEGPDAPPAGAWRDEAAREALLRISATVANHMAEQDAYGFHHLLGDLNARQNNRDEWWYPHPLLEAAFVRDTQPKSIDYMLHSHMAATNGLTVVKRYAVDKGIDSDHPAQVKVVKLPKR